MSQEIIDRLRNLQEKKEEVSQKLTAAKSRRDTLQERKQEILDGLKEKYKITSPEALNEAIKKVEGELTKRLDQVESVIAEVEMSA